MPIDFECPNCMRPLQFPEAAARTPVKCKHCSTRFTLPSAAECRSTTVEVADPVKCKGCKANLARDVVVCGRCGYDFRIRKKRVTEMDVKLFRMNAVSGLGRTRWRLVRDQKGRWTLYGRDFFLFFIPLGRYEFDLRHYQAVTFHFMGPVSDDDHGTLHISLRPKRGKPAHLFSGWSRSIEAWFRSHLCEQAGLAYEVTR